MKKILFRADAKPSLGMGDLASLISLSEYFREDGWTSYFLIRDYPAATKLVEKKNVANVIVFNNDVSVKEEVDIINQTIEKEGIDCLFLEITEFPLSDYCGLSDSVVKACVNFDGHIPKDMDLVVNWDISPEHYYQLDRYPDTKFMFGPEYVIVPKPFYDPKITQRSYRKVPEKLLIAMGGADELDFTQKIVEAVLALRIDIELNIIIGSGYEYKDNLEKTLIKGSCRYTLKENVSDMLREYLDCDIAIGAGGLTSSELVASKTPAILIATYEHQIKRCEFFHQRKLATYMGYRQFDHDSLLEAIVTPRIPSGEFTFKTHEIIKYVNAL